MNARSASATARLIAAATVMRRRAYGGAAPEGAAPWCERFLSTNRGDRWLLRIARSTLGRAAWRLVEAVTVPGVASHWMRRKREIDRLARQAAAEGFSQLVVLGAGLDSLPFRLCAEDAWERVLSADHPATLATVRAAVAPRAPGGSASRALSAAPDVPGVTLLPLDLSRDDVTAALAAAGFDADRATLVIVEGVLMYLPEATVARVLGAIAGLPTPAVRLIASWMVAEPGQPLGFRGQSRLVNRWLRRQSESMLWASTPRELPALLAEWGWSSSRLIDLTAADSAAGAMACGLGSEQLVVAERGAACDRR